MRDSTSLLGSVEPGQRRTTAWRALLARVPLALAACGGDSSPAEPVVPDPVATVLRVSTQTVGLDAIGASQTVTATVLDQNNQAMAATVN